MWVGTDMEPGTYPEWVLIHIRVLIRVYVMISIGTLLKIWVNDVFFFYDLDTKCMVFSISFVSGRVTGDGLDLD